MQKLPLLTVPHWGQVHWAGAWGRGVPQLLQKLPLLPLWPHWGQVHSAAGWGFGLPQLLQNFPVLPL